ncbi:nucleoside-diphosphate sugar epimerase [Candidatus Woesearchaeota archaeon]|nr:nucleoside-diphosphate sugar epimerase [Candidatus Woesearchaeota archaeon]
MPSKIIDEDVETISKDIGIVAHILSGKTLLITGGAGFLGRYFLATLDYLNKNVLEKPCRIISVDNFITGQKYDLQESPTFQPIHHNLKFPLEIDEDIDFIIHAAGIASPKFYRTYKIETIDVGTLGTKHMLELARYKNVKSMVFFSSSEVYGDPDPSKVPTPETYCGNVDCTGPRANYDESKRIGETFCIAYHEVHGIPVKMIRPFNVYGPGMRKDDMRVVPNFILNVFHGNALPVYGGGQNTRTFCYITDAMTGFFKILLSDFNGESFNVGTDKEEVSVETLAKTVASLFDQPVEIKNTAGINDAYSAIDPKRRCPDITKLSTKLGYTPKIDLRSGVLRFTKWAIEDNWSKVSDVKLKTETPLQENDLNKRQF